MIMQPSADLWVPRHINQGAWLTHYSFNELAERIQRDPVVLPICSLGTPSEDLERLAPLVLPPLFHEALDAELKVQLLSRITECFPYLRGTRKRNECPRSVEVVELPARRSEAPPPQVLAFSVDTAVEEHGPHLPLATDRIQSYAVLHALAREFDGLAVGPPLDYGHLTWALPLGLSIDLTPPLTARYVSQFVDALIDWAAPQAFYVVDVHGSPVHRQAVQEGLAASQARQWSFRWLHEPLVEFAFERQDVHAGGVETALIEAIHPQLLDARWWPGRLEELAAGEMSVALALELSSDLPRFVSYADTHPWNGIVGRIHNYFDLDRGALLERILTMARADVRALLTGKR